MLSINTILKKIRNLLPYLLLIVIYFFFVNLEARKESKNKLDSDNAKIFKDDKSSNDQEDLRIKIPVIPYNQ